MKYQEAVTSSRLAALLIPLLCAHASAGEEVHPSVKPVGPDMVRVSWETLSGSTYVFSFSSKLAVPAWLAPDGPVSGNGATMTRDFSTAGQPEGFFHLSHTDRPFTTLGDFDQDGIPTLWEIAQKHDPLDPESAEIDHDLDGRTALAEYRGGTQSDTADPAAQSYVYDDKGRLVSVVRPDGNVVKYRYDATGNITQVSAASR